MHPRTLRQVMQRNRRTIAIASALLLALGTATWQLGSVVAQAQNGGDGTVAASGPPITPAPDSLLGQPAGRRTVPAVHHRRAGRVGVREQPAGAEPEAGLQLRRAAGERVQRHPARGRQRRPSGNAGPGLPTPGPFVVLPREGTWIMAPKGAPDNKNILTIDIPPEWEGTACPQSNPACGANGPRFFARTGCKYSIEHNLAQCETGSCGDAYDCGKQAVRNPPLASAGRAPLSIVEWTFNSQGGQGYDYPDISLVDGVNLTTDVQALGRHCASKPGAPTEPNWLSQNQPLAIHGTDLRESGRCIPGFRLTRGEIGQIIPGQGNPDDVVACFTNCGRYEYPQTPPANCDPTTDARCKAWLAFCCYAPAGDPDHIYGSECTRDDQVPAGCRLLGARATARRSAPAAPI